MARDKKGKKDREEEVGEEVVAKEVTTESQDVSGKKKKNRKKADESDETISKKLSNLNLNSGANSDDEGIAEKKGNVENKKGKPAKVIENDAEDGKASKKKKKTKKDRTAIDSDDDQVETKTNKNKTNKVLSDDDADDIRSVSSKPRMSAFQLLGVEDDMLSGGSDDESKEIEKPAPIKKEEGSKGKKSKKKERRKKDDDDDEDLDKILEELRSEMTGEPVKKKESEPKEELKQKEEPTAEDEKELESTKKSKKKKGKKETESVKEPSVEKDDDSVVVEEDTHTVKTAAQKKKEKKESEKLKKAAQYEQGQKKPEPKKKKEEPKLKEETPQPEEIPKVIEEPEEEDAEDDSKKKKKKKGIEDKKEKEKKRPGKKQIAAMQEALKNLREEEERLKLEEEAKLKAEEEAEILRQEKLRLELERKEKKKQKEKEKRERLKMEGKLLTRTQRQSKARAEAMLAALRQQGVDIPEIGGKVDKPVRTDRKRPPKKKNDVSQAPEEKEDVTTEKSAKGEGVAPEKNEKMEVEETVAEVEQEEEEEEDEGVKDAWDASSEEESESVPTKGGNKTVSKVSSDNSSDESESESSESDSEEESSESENESKKTEENIRERALERIRKRREENELKRSTSKTLRSPIVCVLGHVDTGKTKILDRIRNSHVQDNESGGITQQIGATMVPREVLIEQCRMASNFADLELEIPGLLIIDTPGHESFSNLRSRGSSLCDIAILVVDIMHGLEPQTLESITLLKQKKTPFIVALNKIDRLYDWNSNRNRDIQDVIKGQARNTKDQLDSRAKEIILQFANQGLNAVLSFNNLDQRSYVSMVPTSAISGDGMGNLLALVAELTMKMMTKQLLFTEELQATVLEVKAIPGLGTTIDTIVVNGRLREGDTIVLAGHDEPVVTQIRSLLMPQPLKELRVKNSYEEFQEIIGSQGVKITGKDLDKAIAGLQLLVANHPDEVSILKDEVAESLHEAMSSIKKAERGVYVQASTLGSLEALLEFLKTSKIPYSGIRIGPVVKRDVMKASIMLEHDSQYAVILAFDVRIERDAQELADSLGVKIFQADIIYHLFDKFTAYREELKNKKREEFKNVAVFPCKLRVLPQFIFNSRDPIVLGVVVEAGVVKEGTPLCIPSKEFLDIGVVSTIEVNHKTINSARKGQEVCVKIEAVGSDAPKMYGRHFDHTDMLISAISRQSIDACKEYFRDDLVKTDWQLMVELKKMFQIL